MVGSTSPSVSHAARSATATASVSSGLSGTGPGGRRACSRRISSESARNRLQAASTVGQIGRQQAAAFGQLGRVGDEQPHLGAQRGPVRLGGLCAGILARGGGLHHDPPEVAPADPELDDGADEEPNEPELDDDEPELDDDPELRAGEPVPEDATPEPPDVTECPVPLLAADPVADPVAVVLPCAAAGSSAATTPATATPTIPALMVAVRSRRRARSRATTADTVRSSLFITGLLSADTDLFSLGPGDLAALGSPSALALSSGGFRPGQRGRTALPARPRRPHAGSRQEGRHA